MEQASIKVKVIERGLQDSLIKRNKKFISRFENTVRYVPIKDLVVQKTNNEVC
jgi:hypothetical protein